MTVADLPGMESSARESFTDLRRRLGEPVPPDPAPDAPPTPRNATGAAIVRQLVELDAPGAWVAEVDGAVAGVALAGRREHVWYLGHLHLLPRYQGHGIGRRLLAADLDRALRGGAHGPDLELLLRVGSRMFVVDRPGARGYAVVQGQRKLVAATDEATATALLWTALAETEPGSAGEVAVQVLRADQQWAIDVAVRAGLDLAATGPLCRRGRPGPLAPYLPHPALL